jgi:hypothetical protein
MGRQTNLALLGLLLVAFATGWLGFAFGTAPARWSLALHAATGFGILLLLPWKSIVVRRGLRRPRAGRWASLALVVLVLASLSGGLLHSTGLLRWWGPYTAMELHVGAALAAVPLVVWHVAARRVRPRPTDLRRRAFLRAGLLGAAATGAYVASEGIVRVTGLPGTGRRFTGSYEAGSLNSDSLPVSSWMFDAIPTIATSDWSLQVATPTRVRTVSYEDLAGYDDRLRAVLDCTGGFWSEQEWAGVFLDRLVRDPVGASSIRVVSHTGYDRRFPIEDLGRLLLATRLGGQALSPDHGFPARLVAADRRGFWWVKWVVGIELDLLPHWWQPPFPLQ